MKDIFQVIDTIQLSEKATLLTETNNEYVFKVNRHANKLEIRQAVEELFDVTVTDVRTIKVQSKPKRRGRTAGTRPGWKKAIVELQPGDSIDIFEGA